MVGSWQLAHSGCLVLSNCLTASMTGLKRIVRFLE